MNDRKFLENIKNGSISIDDGIKYMSESNYKDLGFAKIDFDRKKRRNFPEVVFSAGKEYPFLLDIMRAFADRRENVLATRTSKEQYDRLKQDMDGIIYDEVSKTARLEFENIEKKGLISICCGGTSDIPICEEARITAEFFGANVQTFYDVGVAGLNRLLSSINEIKKANVIIAVAGMEGALATVIAGLTNKPVIAVPTSVGYGANMSGITPLLTMLSSCAEGINVVNIDNGYGAAYNACQINKMIETRKGE